MASSTFLSVIFLSFLPQLTNPGFIPTLIASRWGMGVRGKARGQAGEVLHDLNYCELALEHGVLGRRLKPILL